MTVLLTALGVCLVALLADWLACVNAPLGYQDQSGFHHGTPPDHPDEGSGNPS